MRVPDVDFRARMEGRRLWDVTVTSEEDKTPAQPLIDALRLTAGYMKMQWHGALLGYGNRPGDIADDKAALAAAQTFFA
jgi:hypothetical protein